MERRALLLAVLASLLACAGMGGGLGSAAKTAALSAGMTMGDTHALLGPPAEVYAGPDQSVWKYHLHQHWVGFVPHYLIFDSRTQTLRHWYADHAEAARAQQQWAEVLQPITNPPPPPAAPPVTAPAAAAPPPKPKPRDECDEHHYIEDQIHCRRMKL